MGKLKVLPTTISNLIAAGEVVQRPSSVIKELLENSVDAGADTISVVVEDAGRTSMQIVDNGVGMEREEALLSFQRHATSKISEVEDLSSIMTYGFRGEALASIAAVAEVTLRSRKRGTQTGSEVVVSGGSSCPMKRWHLLKVPISQSEIFFTMCLPDVSSSNPIMLNSDRFSQSFRGWRCVVRNLTSAFFIMARRCII